jgi:hypothetical protein
VTAERCYVTAAAAVGAKRQQTTTDLSNNEYSYSYSYIGRLWRLVVLLKWIPTSTSAQTPTTRMLTSSLLLACRDYFLSVSCPGATTQTTTKTTTTNNTTSTYSLPGCMHVKDANHRSSTVTDALTPPLHKAFQSLDRIIVSQTYCSHHKQGNNNNNNINKYSVLLLDSTSPVKY